MKKPTTNKFLIGSWVSFYPFDIHSYEYQLDQMREAGINFNIFPADFGGGMHDADTWNNVEAQYEARDMYYCMYGGLTEELLKEGVQYAKGKNRCIGYHLVDEPGGAALPHVGKMVRAYREADPKRYPFVNLFPSYVGTAVMEGDYYQYCARFVKEAGEENIEYLSHDFYPFHQNGTALSIFGDMEVVRRVAFENGRLRTHGFPQSTAWLGTRMPNIDEMRWNVYAYLAYGFKALSWFNLVCPGKSDTEGECFRESVIYRDGSIKNNQLLEDFGKLNNEVHALGDTLMKLDTVHAYHTKGGIAGVEMLPVDWMITPVGEADFVISHMVTKKGEETYVMLFNKSFESAVTTTFSISAYSGIDGLSYVSPFNGNEYPVTIKDGTFTETFRPGEGKLFKLSGLLTRRVLPIQRNPARLNLEIPEAAELIGLDVAFSADTDMKASTLQITTNKRFPEEKTLYIAFDHDSADRGGIADKDTSIFPLDGRVRFAPYMSKHIRFTVHDEASWYNYGYAEVRVRYAGEPEFEVEAQDEVESVVYTDVNYTALDEAIATFEALNQADYTEDTWHAVKNFYDAAVDMKGGAYPQNAVTVAAWKLQDSIKELIPAPASVNKPAPVEAGDTALRVEKGIVAAAAVALAGAVTGLTLGIIRAFKKKKK